jgi:uncharacterized membrane protein
MSRSEFPGQEDRPVSQPLPDALPEQQSYAARYDQIWQRNGAKQPSSEVMQARRAARALGWFSIGLGVSELVMAGRVGHMAGIYHKRGLLRVLGAREIAHGLGILSGRSQARWVWSRVLGDVTDLIVLGKAAASPQANRARVAAAAAAVAGATALDLTTAQQLSRLGDEVEDDPIIHVRKSVQINRPVQELYRFWRDFTNLPRVMDHLDAVEILEDKRSRWTAKGPAGSRIRWDAEVTEDRPGELIAWRSLPGAQVENWGSVKFSNAPGGRGSFVFVELHYNPPAGAVGVAFAKLFGEEPRLQLTEDLRRFKQLMETGETIKTEGQPAGRSRSTSWKYDNFGRRLAAAF